MRRDLHAIDADRRKKKRRSLIRRAIMEQDAHDGFMGVYQYRRDPRTGRVRRWRQGNVRS